MLSAGRLPIATDAKQKRDMGKNQGKQRHRASASYATAWRTAIDRMLVDVALSHLGADTTGDLPARYAWLGDKEPILAELGRLAAHGEAGLVRTVASGLCELEQPIKLSLRMVRNMRLMMRQRQPPTKDVLRELEHAIDQCRAVPPSPEEVRALLDALRAPFEQMDAPKKLGEFANGEVGRTPP
jgi:hypothetical protein